jgi:hypothetical protein
MDNLENKFLTPQNVTTPETQINTETVAEPVVNTEQPTEPTTGGSTGQGQAVQAPVVPEYFKKVEDISGGKYKFQKDEELKAFFEEHDKIKTEFESEKDKREYYKELEKMIEENGKDYDPVAALGGIDNYKKTVIINELSKRGDPNIAAKVVGMDRSKVDSLTMLSLYAEYQAPILVGDTEASTRAALRQIGIVIDKEDNLKEAIENLSKEEKAIIDMKAREIKTAIDASISRVEIPEIKDPLKQIYDKVNQQKQKFADTKAKWDETMTSLQGSFDKISFKDVEFDFEISEEDKSVLNDFIRIASQQGSEPNEANKQMVIQRAKDAIWDKNRVKIMQAFKAKIEADVKKAKDSDHHNLKPLTTEKIPLDNEKTKEAAMSLRKQMKLN